MLFYVLCNNISVTSRRSLDDNARLCGKEPFTVEKISPRVRIKLVPLDQ